MTAARQHLIQFNNSFIIIRHQGVVTHNYDQAERKRRRRKGRRDRRQINRKREREEEGDSKIAAGTKGRAHSVWGNFCSVSRLTQRPTSSSFPCPLLEPISLYHSPIVSGTSCPKDCLSVTWLPAQRNAQRQQQKRDGRRRRRRMSCPLASHIAGTAGNDNSAIAPGNSTVKSYSNFK